MPTLRNVADDDLLAEHVFERAMLTDYLDVSRVHVAVCAGRVVLSGEMATTRQRGEIEALIAGCDGVSGIDNRLQVVS